MSVTSATAQGESYVYGGVLFQRIIERERDERPHRAGLLTCLSQGLTTGAVLIFLMTVGKLVNSPSYGYNFLFLAEFPLYLGYGLVPGFAVGLIMWACTKAAGHDLRLFTRAIVAGLVFAIPYSALILVVFGGHLRAEQFMMVLMIVIVVGATGSIFGLLTGSRFSPWRQLVRGDDSLPAGSWLITGFTGLLLRLAVAFFLMEGILAAIVVLKSGIWQKESAWPLALLLHLVFAFAIVFARLGFRLLLPLALIVNIPVVLFLSYLTKEGTDFFVYLCAGYLGTWVVFLITRCSVTYFVLQFLKEEVHYYLID